MPPMANVLKVFLENGQTKSFKYDNTTTVKVSAQHTQKNFSRNLSIFIATATLLYTRTPQIISPFDLCHDFHFAQDVVTSLRDKLCLSAEKHFSLVLEHVKSLKRNKLTLLDPQETLARVRLFAPHV